MTFCLTFFRWWLATFEALCLLQDIVEYVR